MDIHFDVEWDGECFECGVNGEIATITLAQDNVPYVSLCRKCMDTKLAEYIVPSVFDNELAEDEVQKEDEITEEKIESYFLASFIASAVDLLHGDKKLKLAHLAEQCGMENSWQQAIRDGYHIDANFVHRVYKVLRDRFSKRDALFFINRGLGNPRPVESLVEVLGDELMGPD